MKLRIPSPLLSIRFWAVGLIVTLMLLYPILCLYINKPSIGITFLITSILFTAPLGHLICCVKNKVIFLVLVTVILLLSMLETGMVVIFESYVVAGNILAILNTTGAEGGGFIKTYLAVGWYFIPLLILYGSLFFIWRKETISIRCQLCLCGFWLILAAGYIAYKQTFSYKGTYTLRFYLTERVLSRPPYNFFHQLHYIAVQSRHKKYLQESEHFVFNAQRDSILAENEIYVLALGESCRYANFSLNGTYRETTPCLARTSNITLYNDYYSAATLTMYSVPQILTRATPDQFELCYKEKSIIQAFAECDFYTIVIAHKDNILSKETNHLLRGVDSLVVVPHDSIIPIMVDSLASIHPRTFFVLQFLGNHGPYINYTPAFDKYHPNINDEGISPTDSLANVNAYDNTILYTDYLLHQIIQSIDKKDVVSSLMFVPDHGEMITNNGCFHGGHCKPYRNEYHVPLVIWNNTAWIEHNTSKHHTMRNNINQPINGDNIFYSVCDMANISLPAHETLSAISEMSIFSDSLSLRHRLILLVNGVQYIELP